MASAGEEKPLSAVDKEKEMLRQIDQQIKIFKKNMRQQTQGGDSVISAELFKSQKQKLKEAKERERSEKRELLRQIHKISGTESVMSRQRTGMSGMLSTQSRRSFGSAEISQSNTNDEATDKEEAKRILELKRREKLQANHKFEKKRDLADEFTLNFYGAQASQSEIHNKLLDQISMKEQLKRERQLF